MEAQPRSSLLPKVGQSLAGKYAIERVIGQGAMAIVYEARHLRLRQRFAIKMLLPRLAEDPDIAARFEREARAVVQLHGPNVAHLIDVDTTPDGLPYIVMELLEGHDLAEEITTRGQLPIAEAVGYILQACSAMYEAHALGIIHRDLKPANMFLCGMGENRVVKVLDFGVSKVVGGSDTSFTATAVVLGTPVYMSPEHIESAKKVDQRTDIWALGVILYELVACELPFRGGNAQGAIASIMADAPKPLRSRRPDAPAGLVDAVMKALQKNPDERFPDVAAFAVAIAPFGPPPGAWRPPSEGVPPSTRAPGAAPSPPPSERRRLSEVETLPGEPDGSPRADAPKAAPSVHVMWLAVLAVLAALAVAFAASR